MIFSEKKTSKGYLYKTKDHFGEMIFESEKQLSPELLDDVFVAVFNLKSSSKTIKGKIKGTNIIYKYNKKPLWTAVKK